MLRMNRSIFEKLCCLVNSIGGLQRRTLELVAIFFVTVGHNIKNRTAQVLFHRSAETISRTIREVLCSILKLHHILLAEPIPVPDNCTDARWKYFKGCFGALDGTLINVREPKRFQARYRTRKGTNAINVLGVCNQNLQFIYCLAGWEGSAHDSRV
ncbi:hypothetical protein LINPERPRIM_LOCUS6517 [Linum perenne]